MRDDARDDAAALNDAAARHSAQATLDAWRASGAHRLDPVRFHLLEAFARRALQHRGDARRVLDERLAGLLDEFAAKVERAAAGAGAAAAAAGTAAAGNAAAAASGDASGIAATTATAEIEAAPHPRAPRIAADEAEPATLAALIEQLRHHHARADAPHAGAYPQLPALDYFRETWSQVRTEKQLRQSLEQVPGSNAGPLNSSSLVHRALSLMREVSPEYLKQFLSYVDTLSWLEQMNGGAPVEKEAPRAAASAKGRRRKPR